MYKEDFIPRMLGKHQRAQSQCNAISLSSQTAYFIMKMNFFNKMAVKVNIYLAV